MSLRNAILLFVSMFASPIVSMAGDGGKVTVSVTPVSQDADAAHGGVVYSLPKTMVRVKLTAQVVVSSVGPFYKYSTRFLNVTDVVTANSVRWSLVGAEVSSYGVANPDSRFKITVSQAASFPSLSLSSDGVLCGVNSAAGVVGTEPVPVYQAPSVAPRDMQKLSLPKSVLTKTSTAAMAEECANVLFDLRDSRLALISGYKESQLPDAGSYSICLSALDAQEKDLVSLFVGRRDTITVVRYVDVEPSDVSGGVVPIRFSATDGFVDSSDLNGAPIYVDFSISPAAHLSSYPDGSKLRKSAPIDGLRYVVPSALSVRVALGNVPLASVSLSCAQGGQEVSLPASFLLSHSIVLDSATGALVSLSAK